MLLINYIMVFQMCIWGNIKRHEVYYEITKKSKLWKWLLFNCKIVILSTFKVTKCDIENRSSELILYGFIPWGKNINYKCLKTKWQGK
jgi:hypothetical protein